MKRTGFLRTGLLCVSMLIAASMYSQSVEDYMKKIQALNNEMVKFMLEGNYEKNLGFYAKDAISMPNYEPMCVGVDAIRVANEKMMKSGYKINSFEPTVRKVIPNGDLITEIGTYKINLNVPGMDQAITEVGKYVTIWEKQKDGSLKIKVETWNSDTNPMMNQAGSGNPPM